MGELSLSSVTIPLTVAVAACFGVATGAATAAGVAGWPAGLSVGCPPAQCEAKYIIKKKDNFFIHQT
jgi:hypothetical protein